MKKYILLVLITTLFISCEKELSSSQLLENTIAYHDPNNMWNSFNASFHVTMETPDAPNRESDITINNPASSFYLKAVRDSTMIEYKVSGDNCNIALNRSTEFTEEEAKANNLNCDRAHMYKNYYSYLYGLPMKLKDPGTNISEVVERKTFKGKAYIVLKATYDEEVGTDIWYFYFDPETYAMEIYQFFKIDENGNQNDESGEYILLTEEMVVNDIKMPKARAWYYNKDDKYLGTDILK
ncbi:MAG: hypothetical protein DA407_00740 [Bacteroidetes bacterium]|nr:MAG: hypothetical protein DA407_00740 [Bacteroidota bacterium]